MWVVKTQQEIANSVMTFFALSVSKLHDACRIFPFHVHFSLITRVLEVSGGMVVVKSYLKRPEREKNMKLTNSCRPSKTQYLVFRFLVNAIYMISLY